MTYKNKHTGFTIVEIVVIITVVALMATVVTFGFRTTFSDAQNNQRQASAEVIAEGLESYYRKNGSYPGCGLLSASAQGTASMLNIDAGVLKLPGSNSENSLICTDIAPSTGSDILAYIGDGTAGCLGTETCTRWTLRYKEDRTGTIRELTSRTQSSASVIPNAPSTTVTTTISGSTAQANVTPVTCPGTASIQYRIDRQINDGSWAGGSWGTALTSSALAVEGYKYAHRTVTRCVIDTSTGNETIGPETFAIRPINTPAAPTVSATSTGTGSANSVTWSWASTCPGGSTAAFESATYQDDATGWRNWTTNPTTNVAINTTNQGFEYRVRARVTCSTAYATSSISAASNEPSFIRAITTPGVATNFVDYTNASGNRIYGWTAPACGPGTTAQWQGERYRHNRFRDSNGAQSSAHSWVDIFYNPTNMTQARTRWENSAAITNSEIYWPRVGQSFGMTYAVNNSPGLDITDTSTGGTSIVYRQIRMFVQYRCINTTTNRLAEGTFTVAPMRTFNY